MLNLHGITIHSHKEDHFIKVLSFKPERCIVDEDNVTNCIYSYYRQQGSVGHIGPVLI